MNKVIFNYLYCYFSNAYSIRGYAKKLNNLAFPYGVDFPDETGKMSQSDKGGRPPPRRSGGEAVDRGLNVKYYTLVIFLIMES